MRQKSHNEGMNTYSYDLSETELENLMDTYGLSVLKLAYSYLRDQALAEDIFQEVFIKVYRSWGALCDKKAVRPWILQITANLCRDKLRSWSWRNIALVTDDDLLHAPAADQIDEQVLQVEEAQRLMELIMELPTVLREVIMLYYYEELTTDEIADILGTSAIVIRTRLHRGRKKIKKSLEREGL